MKLLVLSAVVLLAGCHADRLRPVDGGYEIRSQASAHSVQQVAVSVARELGHPVRERGEAVEVELAEAEPMSERPSRWLRVTATPAGTETVVRVQLLPGVSVGPRGPGSRSAADLDAYTYADLLADRLAEAD